MKKHVPDPKVIAAIFLLLVGIGVGTWWLGLHDYNVRFAIEAGIAELRRAGPLVFFIAMAALPAFGCPLIAFHLTAAPAFASQLGLAGVLAAAGVAILANLILSYWLARYVFRPWLVQIVGLTKYRIPVVPQADGVEITMLLRITPGPPFFLQSYLLGLAEIPFGTYLWISWVIAMAYATGFILFGDAILHGKAKGIIIGISILIAISLLVHLLRRHLGKKRS